MRILRCSSPTVIWCLCSVAAKYMSSMNSVIYSRRVFGQHILPKHASQYRVSNAAIKQGHFESQPDVAAERQLCFVILHAGVALLQSAASSLSPKYVIFDIRHMQARLSAEVHGGTAVEAVTNMPMSALHSSRSSSFPALNLVCK